MTAEKENKTQEQQERCIPVAIQMLKNLNREGFVLGTDEEGQKKQSEFFKELTKEHFELLKENKVTMSDLNFIKSILMVPVEEIFGHLKDSLIAAQGEVAKIVYGKPEEELTVQDLEDILSRNIDKENSEG